VSAFYVVFEHVILAFAAWALAHHLLLVTRVPIGYAFVVAILVYALLRGLAKPDLRKAFGSVSRRPFLALGVAGAGIAAAGLTLFFFRPDTDDYSFVLRTMHYVRAAGTPFSLNAASRFPTSQDAASWYGLNAYEPLAATLGTWLGNDAVWFYQNVGAATAGFLVPMCYFLLFRRLRLSHASSFFAMVAAMGFLLFDGGGERSFGSFAFVRLWQAKSILFTLGIPAALLFAMRYLRRPSPRNLLFLVLVSVCNVALSPVALCMMPLLLLAAAVSYGATFCFSGRRLVRAAAVNLPSAYCAIVAMSFWLLRRSGPAVPIDPAWAGDWWRNVASVAGSSRAIFRDAAILSLLPLTMLGFPQRRFLAAFSLALAAAFCNPLTGPVVLGVLTSSSYWRLCYLFPVPLCFGLIVRGAPLRTLSGHTFRRSVTAFAMLVIMFLSFEASSLKGATLKGPLAHKLPPAELSFSRASSASITESAVVIAPDNIVRVLRVLRPDVQFVGGDASELVDVRGRGSAGPEARRRWPALEVVTRGATSPEEEEVFLRCLEQGVDYIVTYGRNIDTVARLLQSGRYKCTIVKESGPYVLMAVGKLPD
jgi:hypothetical protein